MGNDITVIQGIIAIDPSADVRLEGDEYNADTIKMDFSSAEISRADIKTKMVELQAEYDAQEYARKREAEYPSIGDQLDMIYKDMKNGTSIHAKAVEVIKTKYPKG